MTSRNGVQAPPAEAAVPPEEAAPEAAPQADEAPGFERQSLDYWREMTGRQVARLRARLGELETEAGGLRKQVTALNGALAATGPQPGRKGGRGPGPNLALISEADRELVAQLVRQGLDTPAIRERLSHTNITGKQLYNVIYRERELMNREAQP